MGGGLSMAQAAAAIGRWGGGRARPSPGVGAGTASPPPRSHRGRPWGAPAGGRPGRAAGCGEGRMMRTGAASPAPRPGGCRPPGDPALWCEGLSPAQRGRGNPPVVPEAAGSPVRARCQHPVPRHVPSAVWQWGLAGGEAPGCRTRLALVIGAADNPRLGWAEALLLSLPAATGPALPAAAGSGLPPPRTPCLSQAPGQGWPRPRRG